MARPDHRILCICLFLALTSFAVAQLPPVKFAKSVPYGSGGHGVGAYGMTLGDVNEDAKADVLVANGNDNTVGVLLGNGNGSFQPATTYGTGGWQVLSVAVADVNQDGHLDLVATNLCVSIQNSQCVGHGLVAVLLGNGDGTFQSAVTYDTGEFGLDSVAVADVNGDSKPDLLVANECDKSQCNGGRGSLGVLLGNGNGTFKKVVLYDSGGFDARSVTVSDLNGDGIPDVVMANLCDAFGDCGKGPAAVLMGNGDGTFQPAVLYGTGGNEPVSVSLADVNGDGKLDLLAVNLCGSDCVEGKVGVLLGNGNGTFQPATAYGSGSTFPQTVTVADVNGDGKADLLVANETVSKQDAGILLGNGDGTFRTAITLNSGGGPAWSIAVADLNGDNRPDVLVSNGQTDTVGVALNLFLTTTTTSVLSSANPSHVGQAVTFTATVSGRSSVPDGTEITFYNGSAAIGTGLTTNSVASFTTTFSRAATFRIKAVYSGDVFHRASTGKVLQVVTP